jgi:negative regulator of replication initiation
MSKRYSTEIQIRIDPALKKSLQKQAKREGKTLSELMRERLAQNQSQSEPRLIYGQLTKLQEKLQLMSLREENSLIKEMQQEIRKLQQLLLSNHLN